MVQMWTIQMSNKIELVAGLARQVEADGWDGMQVTDTQNRSSESYVALTVAALATERIHLGIGVTNPVTRHPALSASAAASVQRISGGRMTLSIGRGDSALAHIGLSPAKVGYFERYVEALRTYLHGEPIPLDEAARFALGASEPVDKLGMAGTPHGSFLEWMGPADQPVPLEVAGSGPRVLALAGKRADRAMLAVGANPERIEWGIELVRSGRRAAGLGDDQPIGAFVNLVAHEDAAVARRLVTGNLASTSRFSVMHGVVQGPVDEASANVLNEIHRSYDMNGHGTAGSAQSLALSDGYVDKHGIAGTPDHCLRRLRELVDLGIDKFIVFPMGRNVNPAEAEHCRKVVAAEVLSEVKQWATVVPTALA